MSRIVIIGGMGPQASLELHQRIIAGAAMSGAKDNEDYPEILHASIPIPDFISSGDSSDGLKRLEQSLNALKFRKDDQIILACNTAHLLLPEIEAKYGIRFTSLVDVTVAAIQQKGTKLVGLLASPTTIKTELYEKPLRNIGCNVILPTQEDIDVLEQAIRHVIANGSAKDVRALIEPIIQRMVRDGAGEVVLGCTELSIIFNDNGGHIVDPLEAVCSQIFRKETV
jgi:aspartate racemase